MRYKLPLSMILSIFAVCLMLTSCDNTPKDSVIITDQVLPKEASGESFSVDTAKSWVRFTGIGVGKNRPGTLKASYGQVTADNDQITSGTIILDMTSLEAQLEEGPMPTLETGEIFNGAAFGTSRFELTKIEPYKPKEGEQSLVEGANFNVSGNLQIGTVTKNINFPARIDLTGNKLEANGKFDIERRQWEANYGKNRTLNDNFIANKINFEFYLLALSDEQQSF